MVVPFAYCFCKRRSDRELAKHYRVHTESNETGSRLGAEALATQDSLVRDLNCVLE